MLTRAARAESKASVALGVRMDGGRLRIPVEGSRRVEVRFAPLTDRDRFDPLRWRRSELSPDPDEPLFHQINLDEIGLPDGTYEYEYVLDGRTDSPVPDPYADEITRFGGYRGIFHIADGKRFALPFSWDDEMPAGMTLPDNNQLVFYELPLRWTAADSHDHARQIGLGDFDHLIFEHLDYLVDLGINAIKLLPVQDSPDTLNWGYGTRFFFVPDIDMGSPVDMKFFVKRCHQRGVRVILDVVMNHARGCPLESLADSTYFLKHGDEEGGRPDWGGRIFRFRSAAPDGRYPAREFHYLMAEYWVRVYHIDGFRIDEFKGIDHWEFVQAFRDRAWAAHQTMFPDRPFIVVAEDSWRRVEITHDRRDNPNGRRVVDSIWNFAFRDECRRMLGDRIFTRWGEPSRRERILAAISGRRLWDEWDRSFRPGAGDMAEVVNYITSHDVEEEGEERLMNYVFGDVLRHRGLGSGEVEEVRALINGMVSASPEIRAAHAEALNRVGSGFALLLTSVGIPMFLAGEEFAEVHDLDHRDWRLKMSDPVDWRRARQPGHHALLDRVRDLIHLRTSASSLQRNEIDLFYAHPTIDDDEGVRVFAYCRTGGRPLGSHDQVVVTANCGPHDFPHFAIPWRWADPATVTERGAPMSGSPLRSRPDQRQATVSLGPFQVRVFLT